MYSRTTDCSVNAGRASHLDSLHQRAPPQRADGLNYRHAADTWSQGCQQLGQHDRLAFNSQDVQHVLLER